MFNRKALFVALALSATAVGLIAVFLYLRHDEGLRGDADAHFRDVAAESGITWRMRFLTGEQGEVYKINLYDHGSGLAVADFDGDGHDDIYFVNQLGTNALYRNRGDGTFEEVAVKAGVALGDRICTSATFADYANEGRQSLFVTSTRGGNVLFRNRGDGTFEDITKQAGLTHVGHSQAGYFFDYDNDGYLDLLVLQTARWTIDQLNDASQRYYPGKGEGRGGILQTAGSPKEYNLVYHNEPDGKGGRRFVNVTDKSGLKGQGWAADAAILDYDGDGRPDVLISNMFGPAQLYRNDGNGKFTEVTADVLGRTSAGGMGTRAFDFDNDGRLDLFIVDMHSDMWASVDRDLTTIDESKKYRYMFVPSENENWQDRTKDQKITDLFGLPYDRVLFGNTFFRNLGNGKFAEMSAAANLETFWPWGIATGDFDNDGYEDVFIPSGMGYPWAYWPNRLRMNKGDGTFVERARAEGIEPPAQGEYLAETIRGKPMARSSRAAAVADFDGDGQLDIVVNNFNDRPYYFKNRFPKKNYVAFRLQGTKSNRDAVGAVVRVHLGGQILTRQVNTAGGYLAQSSRTLHFGLGDRTTIDQVEITWPSGLRQVLEPPALNHLHAVIEPAQ